MNPAIMAEASEPRWVVTKASVVPWDAAGSFDVGAREGSLLLGGKRALSSVGPDRLSPLMLSRSREKTVEVGTVVLGRGDAKGPMSEQDASKVIGSRQGEEALGEAGGSSCSRSLTLSPTVDPTSDSSEWTVAVASRSIGSHAAALWGAASNGSQ